MFAPYKAILAEALAPRWTGTEDQKAVLREGLGITPAGEDLWGPLGEATKFLHPEDRVRLLVDLVKTFSGTEEERKALLEIKDVLGPVSRGEGGEGACRKKLYLRFRSFFSLGFVLFSSRLVLVYSPSDLP